MNEDDRNDWVWEPNTDSGWYKLGYYGCAPALVLLLVATVLYLLWQVGRMFAL